jgi:Tol biopolymer transport system component
VRARAVFGAGAVVAASLVVASLAGASSRVSHRGAGSSGLIAFTRIDGLYVMRGDGSGVRRVMSAGPEALYGGGAAWSPDGRRLVFTTWDGIWLMDANGGNRVRVATGGQPYWIGAKPDRKLFYPRATNFGSPAWSADGRRIAFTAFEGVENRDIWVMDADGTNQHRLKKTPYPPFYEGEVDWSPAGGWLVFDSGGWFSDVYVMRTNGAGLRNLTPGGGWVGSGQPSWSSDGRRIVFTRPSGIWMMDAGGRSQVELTRNAGDSVPDWSPDGRKIIFVRTLFAKKGVPKIGSAEIYVMNADGTGLTRLTHNQVGEGSPAWQPFAPS